MLVKTEGRRSGGTEDEMVGWHHRLDGHESEQTQGDGEGWASAVCCSPRGCRARHGLVAQQQPCFLPFLAGASHIPSLPSGEYDGSQTIITSCDFAAFYRLLLFLMPILHNFLAVSMMAPKLSSHLVTLQHSFVYFYF